MSRFIWICTGVCMAALQPIFAFAAMSDIVVPPQVSVIKISLLSIAWLFFISRPWMNVNEDTYDAASSSIAEYRPHVATIVGFVVTTIFILQDILLWSNGVAHMTSTQSWHITTLFLSIIGIVWLVCARLYPIASQKYFFSIIASTMLTFLLFMSKVAIFDHVMRSPFTLALIVLSIIVIWNILFGPWHRHVKVTMLATFIAWVVLYTTVGQTSADRLAYFVSIGIALIPAAIWCGLFWEYHKQRTSMIILMFFAGMLSTAPILL